MISYGTAADAASHRRSALVDGYTFHKSEWMDSGADPRLSPTVALIEQPAHYELIPHFHRHNQFQVFIGGSGRIGSHELQPVTVHYAGAYTGYGPLLAGDAGLKYFTIRAVCEAGFVPVSELRDKKIKGPKRHAQSPPVPVVDDAALAAATEPSEHFAIPMGADGMGARVVQLPARGQWLAAQPAGSQCMFLVVLAGSLVVAGRLLSGWEQACISSDERALEVDAGEGGAQFLCLHMPREDAAYSDVPAVISRTS